MRRKMTAMDRSKIHSILVISLTNLGDIILTTPVIGTLAAEFPGSAIDVVTGRAGKEIFEKMPFIRETIVYKKHEGVLSLLAHVSYLRKKRYDLVVDLKNTLMPLFTGAGYSSFRFVERRRKGVHKKDEHLAKLARLGIVTEKTDFPIFSSGDDRKEADRILSRYPGRRVVLISPGSKSHLKRWGAEKFTSLCERISKDPANRIILTGNGDDAPVADRIASSLGGKAENLCSKTSAGVLLELMKKAAVVITNDSAPLHIASAANAPVVAIFGPSDERKYGPLSAKSVVVKPGVPCRPCEKAQCKIGPVEGCIQRVTVDEVYEAVRGLLAC